MATWRIEGGRVAIKCIQGGGQAIQHIGGQGATTRRTRRHDEEDERSDTQQQVAGGELANNDGDYAKAWRMMMRAAMVSFAFLDLVIVSVLP